MSKGEIPYCECGGIIKPDIVFFGENLPQEFYNIMQNPPEADLVIAAGTSLTVYPAAGFPLIYCKNRVPSILINMQKTEYDSCFDYVIHQDLDEIAMQYFNKKK
jgi:NAD-dependent SIR2 family protein deacetylase